MAESEKLKEVRRFPIDFADIAKQSGLPRGRLCLSPTLGWCVHNLHGDDGPNVGCITPPVIEPGQELRIVGNDWVVYERMDAMETRGVPITCGGE